MIDFGEYEHFDPKEFSIAGNGEMSMDDYEFLHHIFCKAKPKNVVEIGVSAGGTTVFLRSLMEKYGGENLYSFDYNVRYYKDPSLPAGYMAQNISDGINWQLFTGGMPCRHFSCLPAEIDICIIDTVHHNPGEHINILEILPYMRKGGIIVLHDTALYLLSDGAENSWTTRVALNTMRGRQLLPRKYSDKSLGLIPNIGGVVLADVEDMLFPLFSNLTLLWAYMLTQRDFEDLYAHFSKFYEQNLVDIFSYSYGYYRKKFYQSRIAQVREAVRAKAVCTREGV